MGFSSSSNILLIVVVCCLVNYAISGLSGNMAQHPPRDDNRCSTSQNCSNSINIASCNSVNVQCNKVSVAEVCGGAGCDAGCIFFGPIAAILSGQYTSVICCNSAEANYYVSDYDTIMQCNNVECSYSAGCCSCYAYNYTDTRSLDEQLDYDYSIN